MYVDYSAAKLCLQVCFNSHKKHLSTVYLTVNVRFWNNIKITVVACTSKVKRAAYNIRKGRIKNTGFDKSLPKLRNNAGVLF